MASSNVTPSALEVETASSEFVAAEITDGIHAFVEMILNTPSRSSGYV
jgi:hypothetical protein